MYRFVLVQLPPDSTASVITCKDSLSYRHQSLTLTVACSKFFALGLKLAGREILIVVIVIVVIVSVKASHNQRSVFRVQDIKMNRQNSSVLLIPLLISLNVLIQGGETRIQHTSGGETEL